MEKGFVRTAPSPTGRPTLGTSRTAIYNFLHARQQGMGYLTRLEDSDPVRSKQEFADDIIEGLAWLGIVSDVPIIKQSERGDIYAKYVDQLLAEGKAYRCYCSAEKLEADRERKLAAKEKPIYDRTCLGLGEQPGKPFTVRLKVDTYGAVTFRDAVYKRVNVRKAEIGDFIVQRSDGTVGYLLSNVIDDALQNVTMVIRGRDGISNAPAQILLYEALGFPVPSYAHAAFILNEKGQKLSKRNGDASLLDYRDKGYLPEAMFNALARIGASFGDRELLSVKEMVELFDLKNLSKSDGVFDPQKLLNINKHWIKTIEPERLQTLLTPFLLKEQITEEQISEFNKVSSVSKAIQTLQTRSATLVEMAQKAKFYFIRPAYSSISLTGVQKEILKSFIGSLENNSIDKAIEETCKQANCTIKELGPPVRLSLSGSLAAPGIVEIIEVLGTKETIERIKLVIT